MISFLFGGPAGALPREDPVWVLPLQEADRLETVDPWECLREDASGSQKR
jgi:hypothetical protein